MRNCLVTKLKENVNNDNLSFLGKVKVVLSKSTAGASDSYNLRMIPYDSEHPVKMTIVGGTAIFSANLGKELILSDTNQYTNANQIQFKNDSEVTVLVEKYNIGFMDMIPAGLSPNLIFKSSDFASCRNITSLRFGNTYVTGTVEDFGKMINLRELRFSKGNIGGDLVKMIQTMIDNGAASSGTINYIFNNVTTTDIHIKFGKVTIYVNSYEQINPITWESRSKIWMALQGVHTILCVGYSDSEIETKVSNSEDPWYNKTVTKAN